MPGKYPADSYIDADGVVWASYGERLAPLKVSVETQNYTEPSLLNMLDNSDTALVSADSDMLEIIAGLVFDIASDPPEWHIEDLRPVDSSPTILDSLKALVTSILGEYTPVNTTSVITGTVGNDTYQYLVETVADGTERECVKRTPRKVLYLTCNRTGRFGGAKNSV